MTTCSYIDGKGVVILGATSSIARAVAIEFARGGYHVVTAARDAEENALVAADVAVRSGGHVEAVTLDAEDFASHGAFLEECRVRLNDRIEGVVLCFGYLDDQARCQEDFGVAHRTIDVNYTGAVSLLERFAAHFEGRHSGFIAAVGSVAGDRGRQSNYLYGSAKAGLHTYLEGLRNRLHHAQVQVTTIKPGFIDTRMSFGKEGMFLVAAPEAAGKAIFRAVVKRRDVAYVPWFWRYIMLIIRHVPEFVFKRMKM